MAVIFNNILNDLNKSLEDLLDWAINCHENNLNLEAEGVRQWYEDKFGNMTVALNPYLDNVVGPEAIVISPTTISVSGYPLYVEYLQYFGSRIRRLRVRFRETRPGNINDTINQEIMNHLITFCVGLTSIRFELMTSALVEQSVILGGQQVQPNETVTELIFDTINISQQLQFIATFYQGVTTLRISYGKIAPDFVSARFRNLSELSIVLECFNVGNISDDHLNSISQFLLDNVTLNVVKIYTTRGTGHMQRGREKRPNNQFLNTFGLLPGLTELNLKHYILDIDRAVDMLVLCLNLETFWFSISYENSQRIQQITQNLDPRFTLTRHGTHQHERYVYILTRN